MSTEVAKTLPRWFWGVSATALVWNLIGVMTFIMTVTMSPDALNDLPEAERVLVESIPSFVIGAYAVSVFAGVFGCAALLLRKRWSVPLCIASLVTILIQMGYMLVMSNQLEVYGPGSAILPIIIVLVAVFLVWFSRMADAKGWLS